MAARIIVSVVMEQKESITLSSIEFKIMPKFNGNHREKNPVIATVIECYENETRGTLEKLIKNGIENSLLYLFKESKEVEWSERMQGMSQCVYEDLAKNTSLIGFSFDKGKLQVILERVFEKRTNKEEVLRILRGGKNGDASRRLYEAFGGDIFMQEASYGISQGIDFIKNGSHLICHHNCFEGDTNPFQISDNLFSIPFNKSIVFCSIDEQGELTGLLGNILAERVNPISLLEIPITDRKSYFDRVIILKDGFVFEKGQEVLTLPYADYQIVYNINGEERRIIKVHQDEIVATIKK